MLPAAMQNEDLLFVLSDCRVKSPWCIQSHSAEQAASVPLGFFPPLDDGLTAVISLVALLQAPAFPQKYH